jgi:hypothetical protein
VLHTWLWLESRRKVVPHQKMSWVLSTRNGHWLSRRNRTDYKNHTNFVGVIAATQPLSMEHKVSMPDRDNHNLTHSPPTWRVAVHIECNSTKIIFSYVGNSLLQALFSAPCPISMSFKKYKYKYIYIYIYIYIYMIF